MMPIPPEIIEAGRAAIITMTKWGHVADALLAWHLPAAVLFGFLGGWIASGLWKGRNHDL